MVRSFSLGQEMKWCELPDGQKLERIASGPMDDLRLAGDDCAQGGEGRPVRIVQVYYRASTILPSAESFKCDHVGPGLV